MPSNEDNPETKLNLTILWNGKTHEKEYPKGDTIARIINDFLRVHAHDELEESSCYRMFSLAGPTKLLDSSKTLGELNIKDKDFLLLTKKPTHVENQRDVLVAGIMAAYTAAVLLIAVWFLVSIWPPKDVTLNVTRTAGLYWNWSQFLTWP